MTEIKQLYLEDITPDMLVNFHHRQKVNKIIIYSRDKRYVENASLTHEWGKTKLTLLAEHIALQLGRGGRCVAAYDGDTVVGFCCLDGKIVGDSAKYAYLTMLFVDDCRQREGIGARLFEEIKKQAAELGADKIFISANPSYETVSFYLGVGCIDAKEIITEFAGGKQDRYLEYSLK